MANVLGFFGFFVSFLTGILALIARTGAANVTTKKRKKNL